MKKVISSITAILLACVSFTLFSCSDVASISDGVLIQRTEEGLEICENQPQQVTIRSELDPGYGKAVFFAGSVIDGWSVAARGTYSSEAGWTYTLTADDDFEWKALVGPYDAGERVYLSFDNLSYMGYCSVDSSNPNPRYGYDTGYGRALFFVGDINPAMAFRGEYINGEWVFDANSYYNGNSENTGFKVYMGDWDLGSVVYGYFKDLTWMGNENSYYDFEEVDEPDGEIGYQEFKNGRVTVSSANAGKTAYLVAEHKGETTSSKYSSSISRSPVEGASSFDEVFMDVELDRGELVTGPDARALSVPRSVGDTKELYLAYKGSRETGTVKYVSKHLNVWFVPSEKYPSGKYEDFKKYADAFEKIYEAETAVFGTEGHKTRYSNIAPWDANSKVNLVFWDIGQTEAGSGAGGYFSAGDLFKDYEWGNEGHYIYLRSEYLPVTYYDFMVHEFQHLLNYIQVLVNGCGQYPSSWYTEILSVTSETLFQDIGGYTSGGYGRWFITGFDTALDDNYMKYKAGYSYSEFLLRNFGGIELLKTITHCGLVDEEAINYALKELGYEEDYYSVLRKASMAYIDTSADGKYTFNKTYSDGGIKNLTIVPRKLNYIGYSTLDRPKVFARWFSIKKLGTVYAGTTYTLNNDGSDGLNYYVLYK